MKPEAADSGVRVVEGAGALERAGAEAAALGSRALLVSAAAPEPRAAALLQRLAAVLRQARVGQQPFPRVPRHGEPLGATFDSAAEAVREGRCRLVVGLGNENPLDVARSAAASALVPSLLIPTAVGYGTPAPSGRLPLPDVLVLDPGAAQGSPPRRTASLGLALFGALVERYAGRPSPPDACREALEAALRALLDELPNAVRSPDQPGPRAALAAATGRAAAAMADLAPGAGVLEHLLDRLEAGPDPTAARAALLPAALEACGGEDAPLNRREVARFGRQVLGIREEDDGRAALWAAGGVRQWVRSLGFETRLTARARASSPQDESTRQILAAARR